MRGSRGVVHSAFSLSRTTPSTATPSNTQLTLSVVLKAGPDTSTPDPPALLPNVGDSNTTSEDMTEILYYCINNSHNAHYLSWFFHNLQ